MVLLEKVSKIFRTRRGEVRALDGVDLQVKGGEFVIVRGPSGSGKTTLLMILGGMLRPTRGRVLLDEREIYAMGEKDRARLRAQTIGFVFQMFHLVPYLNVLENVLLAGAFPSTKERETSAMDLLERLGLADRAVHRPAELSAGEMQRVAIARAFLNRPRIVLADEPTGNLDWENAREITRHLDDFHRRGGTVVLVTHGTFSEPFADRILYLREGRLE